MSITSDLLRGHTDTIILSQLIKGDTYGYAINKVIKENTNNMYELKEGPTSNNSTYVTREEFNNALNKIQMNFNLLNNQQEPPVAQVPPPEPAPEETQNAPTYKF